MNKILLIDDNMEIQAANTEYLTKRGYIVDSAFSGEEALDMLRKKTYDCIVLDVLMPGMDGDDSQVKGLMAGGDDYMTKPYSLKNLAARIMRHERRVLLLFCDRGRRQRLPV